MECALDLDGTACAGERAGKLDEETVSDGFDLSPAVLRKCLPQQVALLVEQFERERFVPLRQRAVAHHVRKHDGRQPSVLLHFFSHQVICMRQQFVATPASLKS